MPALGRPAKPAGQAINRNKLTTEWIEVEDVAFSGSYPKLPARRPSWRKRTRDKWAAWCAMPHAKLWGPAEWDYALDAIELAARFHEGTASASEVTELRNREKVLGTTLDYRRALRIRYVPARDAAAEAGDSNGSVTSLDAYRGL